MVLAEPEAHAQGAEGMAEAQALPKFVSHQSFDVFMHCIVPVSAQGVVVTLGVVECSNEAFKWLPTGLFV